MEDKEETYMVLKVDLQCPDCYKKLRKILYKFPQIRDQIYNKKANTVTISIICCSPERIRDKLCCKGRKVIKSIAINPSSSGSTIDPGPFLQPPGKRDKIEPPSNRFVKPEGPKITIASTLQTPLHLKDQSIPQKADKDHVEKSNDEPVPEKKSNDASKSKPAKIVTSTPINPLKMMESFPVEGIPSVYSIQPYYGTTYYEGHGGAPQPCYDGHYGYGYYGHGHASNYPHVTRYGDSYSSEENPQGCSTM